MMTTLDVTLLAYNVFLRPRWPIFIDGQLIRSRLLPRCLDDPSYDAVVLAEAIDTQSRRQLLDGLGAAYPYRTRVLGRQQEHGLILNGGVMVLSRWPIEEQIEQLFGTTVRGIDRFAKKGVLYVRFRKGERPVHLLATHTNAEPWHRRARAAQLAIIHKLIDSLSIPASEPVLIAGDLNVDRYDPDELADMLRLLDAELPAFQGHGYTFDPRDNTLARGRRRMHLDYVLSSRRHRRPVSAVNEVLKPSCAEWRQHWLLPAHRELSDHYPVIGRFTFD